MTGTHAIVGDQQVAVHIPDAVGQGGDIDLACKFLLLAPCYIVSHTGGDGDVQGGEEIGLHHIGILSEIGYKLSGEIYLSGIIEVLHGLVTPVGGISDGVGIGAEHTALV